MISLRSLRVRIQQQLTPALWNRLLLAIEQRTPQSGVGTRRRQTPSGVVVSGKRAGRRSEISHPWAMSIGSGKDTFVEIRFERGLVNGIEAQIGGKPMSGDEAGEVPPLVLRREDFGADGLCRIYARVSFMHLDFTVQSVEMVGRVQTPGTEAFAAFKLVGFIVLDASGGIRAEQMLFFNQSLVVSAKRTSGGTATYWWGAS